MKTLTDQSLRKSLRYTFTASSTQSKYKYHNQNPQGVHLEDCVTRAISLATGLRYGAVSNLLDISAGEYSCDKLCICCYHHLLEDILEYPRFDCDFTQTVKQIAASHPNNTLIIRVDLHLTAAVNGIVTDIWDCSDEWVDCFWVVA